MFTSRRLSDRTDIVIDLEVSGDLKDWDLVARSSYGTAFQNIAADSVTETPGDPRQSNVEVRMDKADHLFGRVCIHYQ